MKITGTFLDEISYDIPHQNWGEKEWDADFRSMAAIGIDTVILIRCGLLHIVKQSGTMFHRQAGNEARLTPHEAILMDYEAHLRCMKRSLTASFLPLGKMVGMARFELATFCPPDKRANQAALHPD